MLCSSPSVGYCKLILFVYLIFNFCILVGFQSILFKCIVHCDLDSFQALFCKNPTLHFWKKKKMKVWVHVILKFIVILCTPSSHFNLRLNYSTTLKLKSKIEPFQTKLFQSSKAIFQYLDQKIVHTKKDLSQSPNSLCWAQIQIAFCVFIEIAFKIWRLDLSRENQAW